MDESIPVEGLQNVKFTNKEEDNIVITGVKSVATLEQTTQTFLEQQDHHKSECKMFGK